MKDFLKVGLVFVFVIGRFGEREFQGRDKGCILKYSEILFIGFHIRTALVNSEGELVES